MSTRSIIAMENPDGTYSGIYCHWDGYPAHNGRILVHNYTQEAKIRELIKLGDISTLGSEIGQKHNLDDRENRSWCTAYGRDHGSKQSKAMFYKNINEIFLLDRGQDFVYIWQRGSGGIKHGSWYCFDANRRHIEIPGS